MNSIACLLLRGDAPRNRFSAAFNFLCSRSLQTSASGWRHVIRNYLSYLVYIRIPCSLFDNMNNLLIVSLPLVSLSNLAIAMPIFLACVPEDGGVAPTVAQFGPWRIDANDIRHWNEEFGWSNNHCKDAKCEITQERIQVRSDGAAGEVEIKTWIRRTGRLIRETRLEGGLIRFD